jgi:tetratricopeptide (TPR) repeat protein
MPLSRPATFGLLAVLAVLGAGGGAWFLAGPDHAAGAEDLLPTPPEPPRLAEGPDYDRCLDMARESPEAAVGFAEAWESDGGGEGAQQCGALALLALGEPERAAARLESIAGRSRAGAAARAAVYGQAAQAWMIAGDSARGYAAVTLALALQPGDVDLLIDRAAAAATQRRFAEAFSDLDRATQLDPNRAEAWVYRAAALRGLDRTDRALEDIARALLLEPNNAEALLERGILRQLKGDTAAARADWERAVELAPDTATADLALQNLALNEAGPSRR